jgi:hypothetical protein
MKNRHAIFTAVVLALSPIAQAVVPAPDGGYPGFNTAEGQNALFSRTTGVWNTALGAFTLYSDTTGNGNTAVGINGLRKNVTGAFNTAVGLNALYFNNGNPSFEGSYNSGFGSYALFHNTTGIYNTAFGFSALQSNTTGRSNTAIGTYTLANNTGDLNTAIGTGALGNNGGGTQNTATGASALGANSTGNFNTAMGHAALATNDAGGINTAVGADALRSSTSGGANTALGYGAGANVTTGSFNVYIGTNVRGVADEVGHTYISNISSTQQNLSPVTIDLNTGLLGHEFSSKRYKEDIKPMDKASEALFALKPVTYRYKKEIDKSQAVDYGLVAEEVAKVDPNLAVRDRKGQVESVRYNAINAMLLNEFLKEHKKVEAQQCKIAGQEETIIRLKSDSVRQEATIAELKRGMVAVVSRLKAQDSKIKQVSALMEIDRAAAKVVVNRP